MMHVDVLRSTPEKLETMKFPNTIQIVFFTHMHVHKKFAQVLSLLSSTQILHI